MAKTYFIGNKKSNFNISSIFSYIGAERGDDGLRKVTGGKFLAKVGSNL